MTIHILNWLLLAAPNPPVSWAIVLFFVLLGLIVTLSPVRRTSEVKKPKEE